MNPVIQIIQKIIITINRLIDGLNKNTVKSIKQGASFLLFILVMTGIIIGFISGRESARIKAPPLARTANETFDVDISREKDEGNFGSMLESQLLNETRYSKLNKVRFPSKENMSPYYQKGIIEHDKGKKDDGSDMLYDPKQFEGKYRPDDSVKGDVEPLKREFKPFSSEKEPANIKEPGDRKKPEEPIGTIKERQGKKKVIKKKKPGPISNDTGIIEN